MKGVLILAHGSRVPETKKTIESVAEQVRAGLPGVPVQIAYMEFCQDNIRGGIEKLAAQGVDEILAAPYFLFEGIHIHEDIPREIEKILRDFPGVTLRMGRTLGADPRLAAILLDRIHEML